MSKNNRQSHLDKALGIALMMLFLFASPFTHWWSQAKLPWFTAYALWLVIILLSALLHWSIKRK